MPDYDPKANPNISPYAKKDDPPAMPFGGMGGTMPFGGMDGMMPFGGMDGFGHQHFFVHHFHHHFFHHHFFHHPFFPFGFGGSQF